MIDVASFKIDWMIFVAVHYNEEAPDLFISSSQYTSSAQSCIVLPGFDCIHCKKTLNGFDTFKGQLDSPSKRSSK